MENHPIPQDITGFQFKLIGNMTIKQFAYLAAGIILAWVCYALPIPTIIRFPFVFLFGIIGIILAFLPIEGRSIDVMISHFVKALFAPTQYVYQRTGRSIYLCPAALAMQPLVNAKQNPNLSGDKLREYLNSIQKKTGSKVDEKEMIFFQSLGNLPTQTLQTQPIPAYVLPHAMDNPIKADTALPQDADAQEEEIQLEKEEKKLQDQLAEAKKQEQAVVDTASQEQAHGKVLELEQVLQDTMTQKQELERQLLDLKRKLENQQKEVYSPSVAKPTQGETRNVRSIPKSMGKTIGVPNAPEFPNLVSGIIKDPRGNPLANILVEIKDNEGSPVRAFKTNALGQFASATPLTNGTYTIEFEDPKSENKFDIIQFTASGEIILPIEIISVDTREELRRTLFN